MTRKHYERLAAIVASIPGQGIGPEKLAHVLADFCEADSSRFNRELFIAACEVQP